MKGVDPSLTTTPRASESKEIAMAPTTSEQRAADSPWVALRPGLATLSARRAKAAHEYFSQPISFACSRNACRFMLMPYLRMRPMPPLRPVIRHWREPFPYPLG